MLFLNLDIQRVNKKKKKKDLFLKKIKYDICFIQNFYRLS